MSWLSGLLSAGASILGGIFGGGKSKPQTTTSYVDYSRMVRMAEAAGFNPLTAIRNGGSAGFTVSSSSGGATSTPLSRVAGSLPGMVDNFLTQIDPFNDKSREMQYRIQEAQLANLQADTDARRRISIGGVPAVTGGSRSRAPVGSGIPHGKTNVSVSGAVNPASAGAPQTPKMQQPEATNPWSKQDGYRIDPNSPNAAAFEDRYGDSEVANMAFGAYTGYRDYVANGGYPFLSKNPGEMINDGLSGGLDYLKRDASEEYKRAKRFAREKARGTRFENPPSLSRLVRDLVGGKDLPW